MLESNFSLHCLLSLNSLFYDILDFLVRGTEYISPSSSQIWPRITLTNRIKWNWKYSTSEWTSGLFACFIFPSQAFTVTLQRMCYSNRRKGGLCDICHIESLWSIILYFLESMCCLFSGYIFSMVSWSHLTHKMLHYKCVCLGKYPNIIGKADTYSAHI